MRKRVLLSGAKGFLGKYIADGLSGFDVESIGRGTDNDIICDLSKEVPRVKFESSIVIHCAGKAHVLPKKKEEENEFFEVNTEGTKNLLRSLEEHKKSVTQFVFISTVGVYGLEVGKEINEDSPLLGDSPFARSKIEAEELVIEWGKVNAIPVLIFRLPLVVGNNPPGNLGKMISSIKSGKYLSINSGKAKRSVVFAGDIASCILNNIGSTGVYNLTDNHDPSFREIEVIIAQGLDTKKPKILPNFLAKTIGLVGDVISKFPFNSAMYSKMSNDLTFDTSKAVRELKWSPTKSLDQLIIK
jgi:GlcNAc-P-P-Und epimerase